MLITIVNNTVIPAHRYGGTERVIWWLGQELTRRGHQVRYLVARGSTCDFAAVDQIDPTAPLAPQISPQTDIIHVHFPTDESFDRPALTTIHGNGQPGERFPINSNFVSCNHADRHGATCWVHNGIDPREYGEPDLSATRTHLLFLAKASRREKNLRGAIRLARAIGKPLAVIGGRRIPRPGVRYLGEVGSHRKNDALNKTDALLFPVRWHEPFGLAVVEAMYFGAPVVGTPYGSLPELVDEGSGKLADRAEPLIEFLRHPAAFDRRYCHERVLRNFSSAAMTDGYLSLYERLLDGEQLNLSVPTGPDDTGRLLPFDVR